MDCICEFFFIVIENQYVITNFKFIIDRILKVNNCIAYGGTVVGILCLIFSATQSFLKKRSTATKSENNGRIMPVIPINSRRSSTTS